MQKFYAVLALAAAFIPSSLLAQTAHRFTRGGQRVSFRTPTAEGALLAAR